MPEKMVLEGFSTVHGEFRYPSPAIKAENVTIKEWKPTSDTVLKSDHVIRMSLRTEPNELIRFLPNCFIVRFRAKYTNPNIVPTGDAEAKAEKWLCRAQVHKPPVFLDPCLGGAAFFSKLEVKIRETKMDAPRLEEFNYIYQSLNRRFTTQEHCLQKYSAKIPRISTTAERAFASASLMEKAGGEAMTEACSTLTFDNFEESNPMSLAFGMDGVFPFDSQSNILAGVMGKVVPTGFLRPSTEIYIDLFKRHPMDSCIDSMRISDDTYFKNATNSTPKPEISIELEDLSIMYESFTPEASLLPSLSRGNKTYYVDVPKINHKEISGGVKYIQDDMTIPEGTKAILVCWAPEHQIVYDPATKVNLHARFQFPLNCTELRTKLTGKDGFLFHEGFVNPGNSNACVEPTSKMYHWLLHQMSVYDQPFSKLFPRKFAQNKGYDQIVLLNTSKFTLKEPTTLTVTALFDANGSPTKHRMIVVTLQQYQYTQSENGQWKFDVQI